MGLRANRHGAECNSRGPRAFSLVQCCLCPQHLALSRDSEQTQWVTVRPRIAACPPRCSPNEQNNSTASARKDTSTRSDRRRNTIAVRPQKWPCWCSDCCSFLPQPQLQPRSTCSAGCTEMLHHRLTLSLTVKPIRASGAPRHKSLSVCTISCL